MTEETTKSLSNEEWYELLKDMIKIRLVYASLQENMKIIDEFMEKAPIPFNYEAIKKQVLIELGKEKTKTGE